MMNHSSTSENSPSENAAQSQTLLNQSIIDYMHLKKQEQKRRHRWRWIKRFLFLAFLIYVFYQIKLYNEEEKTAQEGPHIGLIDLSGGIFDSEGNSADFFAKGMASAYKNPGLKALILRINSPGGSPVQADYMFNTLQYYRKKHPDIKTYAVCVDICASAAYYVAAAADEIYANPSSVVGSIGVLYNGFGFVDAMQKVGVTRRLHTAGAHKGLLDPFSPETPQDLAYLQTILNGVHQTFISKVKEGRGPRLKIDDTTFSGLFWTGEQAKERGLIDGFGSSGQIAREVIQLENIVNYTFKQNILTHFSKTMGTAMASQFALLLGLTPQAPLKA